MNNAAHPAGRRPRVVLLFVLIVVALAGSGRPSGATFAQPLNRTRAELAEPAMVLAAAEQSEPDLSVHKSAGPAIPGATLVYTLTIANEGLGPASDIVLTDTLPLGYTASAVAPGCAGGAVITCTLALLDAGASASVTLTLELPPDARGTLSNSVVVTAPGGESDLGDNTDAITTTLTPRADLALVKLDSADPVLAQSSYSYTLAVTNGGPSALLPSERLTVTDVLPAELRYLGAGGDGWLCGATLSPSEPLSASATLSSTVVTCALDGLAPGPAPVIVVDVEAPAEGEVVTNTATVASDLFDPDLTSNASGETTTITPVADLRLTKSAAPDPVGALRPLTYTLVVANAGPSTAAGVMLTDTLPLGVVLLSAGASQGSCAGAPTVVCALDALLPGASVTVTLTTRPTREGAPANTASVASAAYDPLPDDNTAAVTATIMAPFRTYQPLVDNPAVVDLVGSLSISPPGPGLRASDNILVTVTITNQGNTISDLAWADFYVQPRSRPRLNQGWDSICGISPCVGIVWVVPKLGPGESVTLTSRPGSYDRTYTAWRGWLPAGTSDLYLFVDSYNPNTSYGVLDERDETNNIAELHGLTVAGPNPALVWGLAPPDAQSRSLAR